MVRHTVEWCAELVRLCCADSSNVERYVRWLQALGTLHVDCSLVIIPVDTKGPLVDSAWIGQRGIGKRLCAAAAWGCLLTDRYIAAV